MVTSCLLLALVPSAAAHARTSATSSATCEPAWGKVGSANDTSFDRNTLRGVSAQSDSNVLAVGDSASDVGPGPDVLAERWDGSNWTLVSAASPNDDAELEDVDFTGAADAWAVGQTYTSSYWQTLIERWNGASFVRVASPNGATSSGSINFLDDVGGTATDTWAVGSLAPGASTLRPLILHWDGSGWTRLTNPADPGSSDYSLNAVTRVSASRAYAAGSYFNGTRDVPMVLRWNGTTWSVMSGVPKPGTGNAHLLAVRALSSTNVWAVGFVVESGDTHTLILHYDGSTWARVSSPNVFDRNTLNGLAIRTSQDIWAVGDTDDSGLGGPIDTLILHYDGTSWRQVVSPSPSSKFNELWSVAVVSGGSNVWTVGETNNTVTERVCPVRVSDAGASPDSAKVDIGSSVAWAFPTANTMNHSVTDDSGLGTFDSGPRTPGGSYIHTFGAAGTHDIIDTQTAHTSTIAVLPTSDPTKGGVSTNFLVSWDTHDATGSLRYDVQVRGPTDASYITWQSGISNDDDNFVPANWQGGEGTGTYRIRARVRNINTGAMTGWSPPVKITAT
jgi:plastocyanin